MGHDARSTDTRPQTRRAVFISPPDLWRVGFGGKHPLKPERLARTVALLTTYGALDAPNVEVVTPRMASNEELALFTPEYVDAVRRLSTGDDRIPRIAMASALGITPFSAGCTRAPGLKRAEAWQAAERLLAGECEVAFNFSGGLHHAAPARASGFCIFNDVAIAIAYLVAQGQRRLRRYRCSPR